VHEPYRLAVNLEAEVSSRPRLGAMNRLRLRAYDLVFGAAMSLANVALRLAHWTTVQRARACGCDSCRREAQRQAVRDLFLEWSGEGPAKRTSRLTIV
jgi:hypothetical protein